MKKFIVAALTFSLAVTSLTAADMAPLFEGDVFNRNAAGVVELFSGSFVLLDKAGREIRYYAKNKDVKPLEYRGFALPEALIGFENGKVKNIDIYLYVASESSEVLNKRDYAEKIRQLRASLAAEFPKAKPRRMSRTLGHSRQIGEVYTGDNYDVLLRWNSDAEPNGYIIFSVFPAGKAPESLNLETGKPTPAQLAARVEKNDGGDVFISVPMVDQGEKGFCVPATVSRVLRYYGSTVDQNTLAQIMGSDGKNGTNINDAMKALKKNSNKFNANTRDVLDGQSFISRGYRKLLKAYNKKVNVLNNDIKDRTLRKKKLDTDGEKMPAIDPEVLAAARKEDKKEIREFRKTVVEYINKGHVLCWNVLVFKKNKEGGDVAGVPGGHTRIICGYNTGTDEIIFTDSYGLGHETSRMKFDDAWVVTLNVFSVIAR